MFHHIDADIMAGGTGIKDEWKVAARNGLDLCNLVLDSVVTIDRRVGAGVEGNLNRPSVNNVSSVGGY